MNYPKPYEKEYNNYVKYTEPPLDYESWLVKSIRDRHLCRECDSAVTVEIISQKTSDGIRNGMKECRTCKKITEINDLNTPHMTEEELERLDKMVEKVTR